MLTALMLLTDCSGSEQPESEPEEEGIPEVPVPPENGPKLVVLHHATVVRDRPSASGNVLGTLRAGAQVARADQPYSTKNCPGGWYPIRPRGFVCAGPEASTDLNTPAAQLMTIVPKVERALPYRYGRVTSTAAVLYGKLPTEDEQAKAEPKVDKKKRSSAPIGTGANDVPLDKEGRAAGPPVLLPTGEGVGKDGYRKLDSWFALDEGKSDLFAAGLNIDPSAPPTRVLKAKSHVALVRTFAVGERNFGILPDGRFINTDRLIAAVGSSFHGIDLEKEGGLPVAFALRRGAPTFTMENHHAMPTDEELEPREPILLTGRFRTVDQVKYFATRDDQWVRHRDIVYFPKRFDWPDFANNLQKWLDISLANQTLVVWHGRKPIFATIISTGQDRLGDPKEGPATIQGTFRVRSKHVTRAVDDRELGFAYSVGDAPWVMEFAEGFSLFGCYWHTGFGEARSYHDIALSPIDARWIWNWTEPNVPDGWHSVSVAENEPTTIVFIHK